MRALLAVTAVLTLVIAPSAFASYASTRDSTFGLDGMAVVAPPIPGAASQGSALLIQPDGKILVAGFMIAGPNTTAFVARQRPDGRPDTTYGANGANGTAVLTGVAAMAGGPARVKLLALADGQVLVLGSGLARLSADGRRDATFGGGSGSAQLPAGFAPGGVAVGADGKIVVVGATGTGDTTKGAVVRLTPDGMPDPTFAGGTAAVVSLAGHTGGSAKASRGFLAAMVLPSGAVIAAGEATTGFMPYETVVVRLTPTGELDSAFGDQGRTIEAVAGLAPGSLRLASDGSILLGARPCPFQTGTCTPNIDVLTADGAPTSGFYSGWGEAVGFIGLAAVPGGGWLISDARGGLVRLDRSHVPAAAGGEAAATAAWSDIPATGEAQVDTSGNEVMGDPIVQPDGKILLPGTRSDVRGFTSPVVIRLLGFSPPPLDIAVPQPVVSSTKAAATVVLKCVSADACRGTATLHDLGRDLAIGPYTIEAGQQAVAILPWRETAPWRVSNHPKLLAQSGQAPAQSFDVTLTPPAPAHARPKASFGALAPLASAVGGFFSDGKRYVAYTQPGSVHVLDTRTMRQYAVGAPSGCVPEQAPADLSFPMVALYCQSSLLVDVQTSAALYLAGALPAVGRHWSGPSVPSCDLRRICTASYRNRTGSTKTVQFPSDHPVVRDLDSRNLRPLPACSPWWKPTEVERSAGSYYRPLILVGNRQDWDNGIPSHVNLGHCGSHRLRLLSRVARYPALGGGLATWEESRSPEVTAMALRGGRRTHWTAPHALSVLGQPARIAATGAAVIVATGTHQTCVDDGPCATDAWTLYVSKRRR